MIRYIFQFSSNKIPEQKYIFTYLKRNRDSYLRYDKIVSVFQGQYKNADQLILRFGRELTPFRLEFIYD